MLLSKNTETKNKKSDKCFKAHFYTEMTRSSQVLCYDGAAEYIHPSPYQNSTEAQKGDLKKPNKQKTRKPTRTKKTQEIKKFKLGRMSAISLRHA